MCSPSNGAWAAFWTSNDIEPQAARATALQGGLLRLRNRIILELLGCIESHRLQGCVHIM